MVAIEGLICLFMLTHGRGRVAEQSETAFDRGVKVPQIWRPCGRLWLHDGPCVRLQSERENDVWNTRGSFFEAPRAPNGVEAGSERVDFVGPRFDRVLELDNTTRTANGEELHERFEAQQRD